MADFKKRKAVLRQRKQSSDSSDNSDTEDFGNKLEDIRALQKLRGRQNGVSAASLALGKKVDKAEDVTDADPFKMKTGGIVDMKALKRQPLTGEVAEAIGTSFAAETNRRDEDAEMLKYVEEQVAKKKGHLKEEGKEKTVTKRPEDFLYELPDHLKVSTSTKRTEDMLSNSMLSGIPEVDLGIEAKISNIEATEEAKQKLLWERMHKKEEVSDFVPTNMAVNYMQHNRFKLEDHGPRARKMEAPKPMPLRVGDIEKMEKPYERKRSKKPIQDEKATDDFHYEKFKKQMRRF
ncbi:splicing factor C9orf78-like [Babylonia areolata]|uniref:splicing factor C9orf78-like n=1 Tax=Babylonia areolata TaxID=304850 RepID=UPI003FD42CE7